MVPPVGRSQAKRRTRRAEAYLALDLNLRAILPLVGGMERRACKALFRDCACEAEMYEDTIIVHVCSTHDEPCTRMLAAQFETTEVA